MRRLASFFLSLSILGGIVAFFMGGKASAINFETGFWSALLVVGASAFGYWQMVSGAKGVKSHYKMPDAVDSIDDRYGLWEEDSATHETDVATLMKEEKARLKKSRRSLFETLKSAKPAISLYRLVAYLFLVAGVLWLMQADLFEPIAYFAGAGLSPLALALLLYFTR